MQRIRLVRARHEAYFAVTAAIHAGRSATSVTLTYGLIARHVRSALAPEAEQRLRRSLAGVPEHYVRALSLSLLLCQEVDGWGCP